MQMKFVKIVDFVFEKIITVDGSEIRQSPVEVGPYLQSFFLTSFRWLAGFLPSTVFCLLEGKDMYRWYPCFFLGRGS